MLSRRPRRRPGELRRPPLRLTILRPDSALGAAATARSADNGRGAEDGAVSEEGRAVSGEGGPVSGQRKKRRGRRCERGRAAFW